MALLYWQTVIRTGMVLRKRHSNPSWCSFSRAVVPQVHELLYEKNGDFKGTAKVMDLKVCSCQ